MTYVVELEENGGLHLPDDVLESLKLKPGAKFVLENRPEDHRVILSIREDPPQTRVYDDRGVLVYRALSSDPTYDLLGQIDEMREERIRHIMGWSTEELGDDEVR